MLELQQETVAAIQIRIELGSIKCINKMISTHVNVFHICKQSSLKIPNLSNNLIRHSTIRRRTETRNSFHYQCKKQKLPIASKTSDLSSLFHILKMLNCPNKIVKNNLETPE
jgi:hypothetical protein